MNDSEDGPASLSATADGALLTSHNFVGDDISNVVEMATSFGVDMSDHGNLEPCSEEGNTEENVLSSYTDPRERVDHGDYDAYAGSVNDNINVTDNSSMGADSTEESTSPPESGQMLTSPTNSTTTADGALLISPAKQDC